MKKPIRNAGIAGILCVIAFILLLIIKMFPTSFFSPDLELVIYFLISFFIILSNIFFFYGFIILSRKLENKLLKVTSRIGLISTILIALFLFIRDILIIDIIPSYNSGTFLIFFLIFLFLVGVYYLLFGIGELKLKKKLNFNNLINIISNLKISTGTILVAGFLLSILSTISPGKNVIEYPLYLLFFIILITYTLDTILLFKASKELEG